MQGWMAHAPPRVLLLRVSHRRAYTLTRKQTHMRLTGQVYVTEEEEGEPAANTTSTTATSTKTGKRGNSSSKGAGWNGSSSSSSTGNGFVFVRQEDLFYSQLTGK